jgi:hypothetical protein
VSVHGASAYIAVNDGTSLRNLSTYVDNTDWSPEQDVHDDTTYGATGHTYRGGLTNGTFTISGMWDPTTSTGPDAVGATLLAVKTPTAFEFGPQGNAAGKIKKSGSAVLKTYNVGVPVAGLITFSMQFQISGAITQGVFP